MSRLIDDLRVPGARVAMPVFISPRYEEQWQAHTLQVCEQLQGRDLPVLLIDNVAHYYYTASDQEHWDLRRDFPNLAPPYPRFWCEYKLPRLIHSKEKGDTRVEEMCTGRVGALITAVNREEANGVGIPDNVRWILWCEMFIDYNQRGVTAMGTQSPIFIAVDAEGVVVREPWMQSFANPDDNEMMRALITWFHPAMLAISFLHCKNVRIEENHVPKPLAKKYRQKHGIDPTPYKTLVIEPLKALLRSEGRSEAHGLAKAMHICRGHFRDYREGRGLFGKYHQLVWTPSVVRGTKGKEAPPREIEVKV
jgi:hypothetical protein